MKCKLKGTQLLGYCTDAQRAIGSMQDELKLLVSAIPMIAKRNYYTTFCEYKLSKERHFQCYTWKSSAVR